MSVLNDINKILSINDSYKAPDRIMNLLLCREEREPIFLQLLELFRWDVSYDWFHEYFQLEHAERKDKKQDFTPMSVANILSKLTENTENNETIHEVAAGTGGIIIAKWHENRIKIPPFDLKKRPGFDYNPSNYLYILEELSDRAIPFLLLNLMIRGMNAVVLHGDSLEREFKQVYFVQNSKNNPIGFSDLNVMPRSKDAEQCFNVRKWIGEPLIHIESEF